MAVSSRAALPREPDPNWEYCGVKLTIHNIIIPVERLSPTPSQLDNMDPEMEINLRIVGCELIQDSGVLLKLPQVAMATAQVLYQRFFYSKSFVRHFYELVICYLQALGQESNAKFVQTAWNYMNDSLRTDLFVRYLPEAIACACIYLASCKLGIPLPRHPAWWEMFTVDEESVREIALCLVRLYARPKADIAELETELAKLRKSQVEAKEREIELKKVQSSVTPDHTSDHSSVTLSPNALTASKKPPVTSKGSSSSVVGDPNASVPDMTQSLPPNSILASALATAKAVAASITASKTVNVPGTQLETDVNANSGSHPGETMEPHLNPRDRPGGRPRRASRPSPDSREIAKRQILPASSGRPAAYPSVSPEQNVNQHGAYREKKRRTKIKSRHRSLRSPSSSSSTSDERTNAHSSNNRHYRSHRPKVPLVNDQSTSGSGTPSSSPSPPKRQRLGISVSHNPRRMSPSSVDSLSSVSSVESPHTRANTAKSNSRGRKSPPAAYRLDRIPDTDTSVKNRLSSKPYLSNGANRNSENRSHRHRDSTDRRHVSREHRRR
ncbi:Cyclin-L2 [Fasciola hepatica]|uniref:Cyclin-L2 n=1 Tax=Fasciola hepatica TaxID=6192 RepID=A0A4E0RYE3_FASHE|nr:Cyclin-L2 [Fasciola hepatica]